MKKGLYIIVILFLAGSMKMKAQQEGSTAPDFEADLLGGEKFRLSEQEGKVVLVFLFGNSCPGCIAAGTEIESSIYQVFKDNPDFTAIGLDTWDTSSNESTVTNFRSTTGISFPLGLKAGAIAAAYATTYDRLMVIDQGGILVHKGVLIAANDINNTVQAIEQSLAVTGAGDQNEVSAPKVYPNPSAGVITFDPGNHEIAGVTLHDAAGRIVFMEQTDIHLPDSAPMTLNLDHLERGIYFYTLTTLRGSRLNGHLIIQR